jgi:heme-degrading monooxygenase HmoA
MEKLPTAAGKRQQVWLSRDSHLDKVPGFVEFHLLKRPEAEDHAFSHGLGKPAIGQI